jgi:hypothetical protein
VSITVSGKVLTWSTASGGSYSVTVVEGKTATYNLQVAGWMGASGAVSFACTNVPTYATCSVTSTASDLSGIMPIPVTVTVATQTSVLMQNLPAPGSNPGSGVPITLAAGLAVCLFGLRKRGRRLRCWSALAICLMALTISLVTGCGSKNFTASDTQDGSYALTVTATSDGVSQSTSLTLNVQ